ncbi:hypothetical protein ABW21_db0203868 [Orbilia brochopaga]|nr:hypothetical protein ABW21_db0203868 [Drechslerella brochopaga]
MCHINRCPNEVLLEIFSYLNHDHRTGFGPMHYSDGAPTEQVDFLPEEGYREPRWHFMEYLSEAGEKKPDRKILFDLRQVCQRFNTLVTPIAFSKIRIAHSLEHTHLLCQKLMKEKQKPLAGYVKHITISPRGLVSKYCSLQGGSMSGCYGKPMDYDPRWGTLFMEALKKLFYNLPPNVTELTIRDVDNINLCHESSIDFLNHRFHDLIAIVTRDFSNISTGQLRKFNFQTDSFSAMDHLHQYLRSGGSVF